MKTSRWFGNPLFESIENAARSASFAARGAADDADEDEDEEDEVRNLDSDEEDGNAGRRKKARRARDASARGAGKGDGKGDGGNAPLDPEDIIASMPKTDKQKRHEKRLESMGRMERRNTRRERALGAEGGTKVAPGGEEEEDAGPEGKQEKNMSENEKRKMDEARALIKAGMGSGAGGGGKETLGFEVVAALPVLDARKYDSENEDYDSDDHARTLALGTMILRKSKEKSMVDASYNRYAWNDPSDLPDWFVDDETKHYRPQLPIPQELVDKTKAKYLHLATKPIAKVAEARARKGRMAKTRLAAAKKKAEAVANSSESSSSFTLLETQGIHCIS